MMETLIGEIFCVFLNENAIIIISYIHLKKTETKNVENTAGDLMIFWVYELMFEFINTMK